MRLIDADELKKPIYAEEDNITGSGMTYAEMDGYNDGIDATWGRIENAPTIDAVTVVHGRLVYPCDDDLTIAVCSNCKGVVCVNDAYNLLPPIDEVKYCYHCGAKMDEVSE